MNNTTFRSVKNTSINKSSNLIGVTQYPARVEDIILDSSHPLFMKMGGWSSIGMIRFQPQASVSTEQTNFHQWAYPATSFMKQMPLIGETVLITDGLPTQDSELIRATSVSYYSNTINIFNNPHVNPLTENPKLGNEFKEKEKVVAMRPNEGDVLMEGRFGQSIRFGSHKGEKPVTIIRNHGEITNDEQMFDLENESNGTIVALFSGRKITTELAYSKFETFTVNENTDLFDPKYAVDPNLTATDETLTLPENDLPTLPYVESEDDVGDMSISDVDELWVDEDTILDSDFQELPVVEIDRTTLLNDPELLSAPLTGDAANVYGARISAPPINEARFASFCGGVEKDIRRADKAMLDVIAYAEGTIGRGYNGYNIVIGGYTIKNWTPTTNMPHPNTSLEFKTLKAIKKLPSTACGRYQFLYGTWKGLGAGRFTKRNQDVYAARKLKDRLRSHYDNLHQSMSTLQGCTSICKLLSPEWASFPYHESQARTTVEQIFRLYQIAYARYGTK